MLSTKRQWPSVRYRPAFIITPTMKPQQMMENCFVLASANLAHPNQLHDTWWLQSERFFFFFFQLLFCQQMFLWDLVMRYPKDGSRVSILEPLHWRGLFWWVYFLFRARFSGWKFKRLANIFQSNYQTIVSLTWKTKPNSLYCVFSCIKNEVCNCCRFKYTYTLHILYIRFVSIY